MNRIVKILLIALFAVIIAVLLYNAFGKKNNNKKIQANDTIERDDTYTSNDNINLDDDSDNNNPDEVIDTPDTSTSDNEVETREFVFVDEFGSGEKSVVVNAIKYVRLGGFSGASANVYYIDKNYVLYHLDLIYLNKTILSDNIVDIESDENGVYAYYDKTHKIKNEDKYIIYKQK